MACIEIAKYIAGSEQAFVELMNQKAQELGLTGTNFVNTHGLHDENTYTTARDICRITEAALENEDFRAMFSTAKYTVPATNKSEERAIKTTNNMMNEANSKYYDKRVTGGKTGATDEGGRCLTLTAEKDGMQILCVLMGATPTMAENGSVDAYGSFEESKILIDYAFDSFEFRQVFFDGQSLTQYPVSNGASHVVTQATTSISTVLPIDVDETQLKWDYRLSDSNLTAPIEKGQILGAVQVWYGTKCLAQTDMVAMNGVKIAQSPIIPEKPEGAFGGGWLTVLLIILGLAVLAVVGMVGLRVFHIMKHQQRQRRRSRRR